MSEKGPIFFAKHIKESIQLIEKYTKDANREKFMADLKLQDAVVRRIETIGEAVKNLPIGFTTKYPFVKWEQIARTRDKLIHHYFGIDLGIVWKIVKEELPRLKKDIQEIIDKESKN